VELVAAITAGGRVGGEFAAAIGTDVKALAPFGGRRLIDAAIDAARGAGAMRVAVIGGDEVRAYCGSRVDAVIDESRSGEANLRRALSVAGDDPLVLLTSDLPFVCTEALAAFLGRAGDADVAMPVASGAAYAAAFPGAPAHVVTIGGESIANGSAFSFASGTADRIADVATRLFAARKSLPRMAALLGPALLARFLMRRLRIADIERRADELFKLRIRAVRDASPALCYDVDTQADYEYAIERLRRG
jgi:CTP:molybdopterin cytidylyltransferase MocA